MPLSGNLLYINNFAGVKINAILPICQPGTGERQNVMQREKPL